MQTTKIQEDLKLQKDSVTSELSTYFQQEKNMAPIAGKILSTLIITGNIGITFERLVTEVNASKSTVITYLNELIKEDRVSFYSKEGDRKRYFILAPNFLFRKINAQAEKWLKEIAIRKKVLSYKENHNRLAPESPYSLICEKQTLEFLEESVSFFEHQIEKIKS